MREGVEGGKGGERGRMRVKGENKRSCHQLLKADPTLQTFCLFLLIKLNRYSKLLGMMPLSS